MMLVADISPWLELRNKGVDISATVAANSHAFGTADPLQEMPWSYMSVQALTFEPLECY